MGAAGEVRGKQVKSRAGNAIIGREGMKKDGVVNGVKGSREIE